jgi:hypothetical protein
MQAVTSASNAASKFASSNAYRNALQHANSNAAKTAGVVGIKAMNSLANKIVNKSANLTKVVNQAAQNPTPGNLSQVPVAAAGLEGAVRQANVTVNQSNKNAAQARLGYLQALKMLKPGNNSNNVKVNTIINVRKTNGNRNLSTLAKTGNEYNRLFNLANKKLRSGQGNGVNLR